MLSALLRPAPLQIELGAEETHICYAALDQQVPDLLRFFDTLSGDEQSRAERFYFDRDRKRYIVRRGILRTILARYLSTEPNRIQFCYGKNGKPSLTNTFYKKKIHFSLSHSNGLAAYAFTRGSEIGLDIEHIHDFSEMEHVAEQFFSLRENAVFRALPESKKAEAFFNCWTRKEAFIKAIGDGLSQPLDEFDVSLAPGEPAQLLKIRGAPNSTPCWSIQGLKPAPGFAAAFAVQRRRWKLYSWQWQY